ncbi:MAG: glycosyltransferase family 2 protein [Cytophagales bacterium]|nr:glycosyltransferase family 2 protein [Cytophagales bacterium]
MSEDPLDLSLIIPVYNEEESLPKLHDWLHRVLKESKLTAEIIFIDDGSSDRSWPIIREFCKQQTQVKALRLQGNQGKSFALQAGFDQAQGDVVITLDADMQDSPDEIPELYRLIKEEAYDLVSGWKKKRYDPLEKRLPSRFFNGVTRWVSGIKLHDFNCGLKAYRKEVVKSITLYGEMHRYIPLLAKWNGFGRIGEKVVEHRAREFGKTKFGLERYLTGFLDLISVVFVTRFKKRPMHFFGGLGSISIFIGLSITTFVIGDKIYRISRHLPVRDVVDQPLFFLALVALVVGVQLFLAGFIAELILRVVPRKKDQVAEKLNG